VQNVNQNDRKRIKGGKTRGGGLKGGKKGEVGLPWSILPVLEG